MAVWKKIVYPVAALIVLIGYITLAAFVLNVFFKPAETAENGVTYGAYLMKNADGVPDEQLDNDETVFNNIDGGLLHSGDAALNQLKLITLYDIQRTEGQSEGGSIEIEISEELFADPTLGAVYRREDMTLERIDIRKEIRSRDNGEQTRVIVLDVQDTGYYGIVSQRKVARYDWLLAAFCIAAVCGLFILLFVISKGKTEKHRAAKE